VWAHEILFDETKVAEAVDSALQRPAVVDDLAAYVTAQAMEAVDLEARVVAVLPDPLTDLAPALVGGIRSLVERETASLLADDDVRRIIVTVVERGHRSLMALLEGDGLADGITVRDGEVSVNLLPLVGLGLQALVDVGFLDGVVVPELDASGDPTEQIALLESAIGRDLPADFGQLVVYRSDAVSSATATVAAAQRAIAVVKRSVAAVLGATAVAFAASLLCARRRRRAALVLLLAAAGACLVARALIERVVEAVPELAVDPGAREALAVTTSKLAEGLLASIGFTTALGLIAALCVYLSGPLAARRATIVAALVGHRDLVAITSFGLAVVVIAVAGLSIPSVALALVPAALGAWALWWPSHRAARTTEEGR
jgi:hypothetical protein